jgi:aldose 1-epimerase
MYHLWNIIMKMYFFSPFLLILVHSLLVSCSRTGTPGFTIAREDSLRYEGRTVELFRMTNRNGMTVKVTNYGASLTFVSAPDKEGVFAPVVLGLDSLRYYLGRQPKLGATVGRYANRIRNAELVLNDRVYYLDKNNKGHSIHGGVRGFHTRVFNTDTSYVVKDTAVIRFSYLSPDAEGGFPGNLNISLAYKLTHDNEVILDYRASTDKPTVVNLTNHSYFNLTGCKESVLNHYCMIDGDSITPVDAAGIPTGELMAVAGTEYDFRTLQPLGGRIGELKKGYDTNYKLNKQPGTLALAAKIVEPESGRVLKAYTTEPGMQFYTPAANLDYLKGHGKQSYGRYYGFCLEMQHFPDSPHNLHFLNTVLLR